ncbi:Ras protein-specific guanine nucleotide-releasing factor [Branchiostoma belcheri]|nr:Ras protein-specific guanine nucleotide-releasing factor [Branchiostoma belcheri]
MQKAIRFSEGQLLSLSACARADATLAGFLYKRSSDTGKWQQRWFALYQNFLFYFENDTAMRPSGLALIEGCQCERVISTKGKDSEKQFFTPSCSAIDLASIHLHTLVRNRGEQ